MKRSSTRLRGPASRRGGTRPGAASTTSPIGTGSAGQRSGVGTGRRGPSCHRPTAVRPARGRASPQRPTTDHVTAGPRQAGTPMAADRGRVCRPRRRPGRGPRADVDRVGPPDELGPVDHRVLRARFDHSHDGGTSVPDSTGGGGGRLPGRRTERRGGGAGLPGPEGRLSLPGLAVERRHLRR